MGIFKSLIVLLWLWWSVIMSYGDVSLSYPSFPALILIGDSTLDTGNNNYLPTIFKCNHSPYGRDYPNHSPTGRWSDGYMVLDYVAEALGLPSPLPYLDPNAEGSAIKTGINLASGGAGVLDITGCAIGIANLSKQMGWYIEYKSKLIEVVGSESEANYIISNALHVMSVGTNDYLVNHYIPPGVPHFGNTSDFRATIFQQYETNLENLYQSGARIVVTVGIPPMGCLPYVMAAYNFTDSYGCVGYMNDEAQIFNQQLQDLLSKMRERLPGMKLIYMDSYNTLLRILNNAKHYGFEMTTRGCCGHGVLTFGPSCTDLSWGTCQNTQGFVFFDAIHPTQHTAKLAAQAFLSKLQTISLS